MKIQVKPRVNGYMWSHSRHLKLKTNKKFYLAFSDKKCGYAIYYFMSVDEDYGFEYLSEDLETDSYFNSIFEVIEQ